MPRINDLNWNPVATGGPRTTGGGGGGGRSAFGSVPAPIATPPNIYSQVSGVLPGLGGLTSGSGGVVGSELSGQVSPATMKALQNAAATFGVQSGTGFGAGTLAGNAYMGNVAGYSENRQRQGLQDYLSLLSGVGHTMTDPGLAAEIASRNATLAAAPDPRMAAEEQLRQWKAKFDYARMNSGGPSGGTGAWGAGGRPPDAPSYGGGGGRAWWDTFGQGPAFRDYGPMIVASGTGTGFGTASGMGTGIASGAGATMIGGVPIYGNPAWGGGGSTYMGDKYGTGSPYGSHPPGYGPMPTDYDSLVAEYFPETTEAFWTGVE